MVVEHSGHREVFDGNDIKASHEHRGQLMQGIRADLRNPGMESGDASLSFRHILRLRDGHPLRNGHGLSRLPFGG
jgi:hypothetical protein